MASHPYISGAGNITQMIGFLRKNFPATVTSDTVKKLGLAPKNESYVINALQFLGLIDEEGKRVESGHEVMTIHDENKFQSAFASIIQRAYSDLFEIRGDEAWTLSKDDLIGYFRSADKTSDITVRIEINLPAEGTQETYDAIFKSIKENLYPCS